MRDALARFAEECGLRQTSEPLLLAPRDVLTRPDEAGQAYLVTLRRDTGGEQLRILHVVAATAAAPATAEVLWWLGADAWAVEQSGRDEGAWAATYGYPHPDAATGRLFQQHLQQTDTLRALLGGASFERLLSLYRQDILAVEPS